MSFIEQVRSIALEMKLDEMKKFIDENKNIDPDNLDIAMKSLNIASALFASRKRLHKLLCATFQNRFGDLSSLVTNFLAYAVIAKHLAFNNEIDNEVISQFLTQQQIIAVKLAMVQNLGSPIENPEFQEACDLQIEASHIYSELQEITSIAVTKFAPNMVNLIGKDITAHLISLAGGLKELSEIPTCNIKTFGANKTDLMGRASSQTGNHQGIIYRSEIVQQSDPEERDRVFRDLANKVSLCSRVDVSGSTPDGSYGKKMKEKVAEKVKKREENFTPKFIRPLPIPGESKGIHRGGRQARARKKKFGMSEEMKKTQIVAFGVGGQFSETGEQYGYTALSEVKHAKPSIDEPFQKKIKKKLEAIEKMNK